MAAADYRLCDACGSEVFYDANLNYDEAREKNDPESFRVAGAVEPWGARLDYLGDWAVICSACAKTHKTIVVPIDAQKWEQSGAPQPQPQPQPDELSIGALMREQWRSRVLAGAYPDGNPNAGIAIQQPQPEPVSDPRPCTCHPDDNPPVPCAQQYALSECRAVSVGCSHGSTTCATPRPTGGSGKPRQRRTSMTMYPQSFFTLLDAYRDQMRGITNPGRLRRRRAAYRGAVRAALVLGAINGTVAVALDEQGQAVFARRWSEITGLPFGA